MNSFLSTTHNRQTALSFIPQGSDRERILFEITANPQLDGIKPFADITSLSCFPDETEVLFMPGSIFRLDNIDYRHGETWIAQLTLRGDYDHDLKVLFDYMRNEYCPDKADLLTFGNMLRDYRSINDAEKYYRHRLEHISSYDLQHAVICLYSLGTVTFEKGMYECSSELFQKTLEIEQLTLQPDDPTLASTYNSIGNTFLRLGDHEQALGSYTQALTLFKQVFGENDFRMAIYLNNIGVVHIEKKNWLEALDYLQKALIIRQKHLPLNHPWFGSTYNNIGIIYDALNQPDLALKQHDLSLQIYYKSLSPQHSLIGMTLHNKGTVYEKQGNLNEALSYYNEATIIYRYTLPSTHPYCVRTDKSIRRILSQLKS
jgi:tetratricopeptide (TPR) repeat protein